MKRLVINNFGPITECDLKINKYMVFTGAQGSGKSTVAKSIFFFNNLGNVLYSLISREVFSGSGIKIKDNGLMNLFRAEVQRVFSQSFGVDNVHRNSLLRYYYNEGRWIAVNIGVTNEDYVVPDIITDDGFVSLIKRLQDDLFSSGNPDLGKIRVFIEEELFFFDKEVVYIPAGRSVLTTLSNQINYIYATMNDNEKNAIDYCTRNFIERVIRIRSVFSTEGDGGLQGSYPSKLAERLLHSVLGGEYKSEAGIEHIYIDEGGKIRMNYASSGQQEAIWILYILLYYYVDQKKALFIIEEPESHLFPEAQKHITEFISLMKNEHNSVIITTHSPYVLGTINNLLFANKIKDEVSKEILSETIPDKLWLRYGDIGAFFLKNGILANIADDDNEDIDHGVIDDVSGTINDDYEKMITMLNSNEV